MNLSDAIQHVTALSLLPKPSITYESLSIEIHEKPGELLSNDISYITDKKVAKTWKKEREISRSIYPLSVI